MSLVAKKIANNSIHTDEEDVYSSADVKNHHNIGKGRGARPLQNL